MIIFRYLTKEVYSTLLAATFILLLIFISNQFIHYLGRAASGGIPIRAVMRLMSLQVPLLLGYMLPLALFLGILLTYGRLYVDSEMTILSACGTSKWQMLAMTLGLSSVVVVIVAILMFWVEPRLAWYRDQVFAQAAVASPIETIFPGQFQTLGDGKWVVYVGDISRDRTELHDVFVAKMPDAWIVNKGQPWTIVSAEKGHQWLNSNTGDQFMALDNGYRYLGSPGLKDFQIVQYGSYDVRIPTNKFHMKKEAEFMPTTELWQKRNSDKAAAAELQWRFTMPVSTFILAFMAVPLSRVRPRKGRYAKIIPAILLYIIYADLIFVGEAAIQKGTLSPLPGLWLIHLLMFLIALFLMAYFVGWHELKKLFSSDKA